MSAGAYGIGHPTFYGWPDPRSRSNVVGGCFVVAPVVASERDLHALAAIVSEDRPDLPDGGGLPPSLLADLVRQIRCDALRRGPGSPGEGEAAGGSVMGAQRGCLPCAGAHAAAIMGHHLRRRGLQRSQLPTGPGGTR